MPRGDRTGPMGQGPMTGRRAGFCAGNNMPGFANPMFGYGRGMGYGAGFGGGGRGRRNRYYATGIPGRAYQPVVYAQADPTITREQELQMLINTADEISASLDQIKKRIEELKSSDG